MTINIYLLTPLGYPNRNPKEKKKKKKKKQK